MGCLLKANLEAASVTEIQQILFDRFLENPEDSPYRCACLYCIQMISMMTALKFNKIRQLAQETVRSIRENDYGCVLYELSLLECVCSQVNKEDIQ